jgi:UDP-N-acetyl-D-galactosamine dehydrogenase
LTLGRHLKTGDIVVYESTVYQGQPRSVRPDSGEDLGLKFNRDFFCGYSPGGSIRAPGSRLTTKKVASGSTPETADLVDALYCTIVPAGTHKAPSIKVEATKVIENAARR